MEWLFFNLLRLIIITPLLALIVLVVFAAWLIAHFRPQEPHDE